MLCVGMDCHKRYAQVNAPYCAVYNLTLRPLVAPFAILTLQGLIIGLMESQQWKGSSWHDDPSGSIYDSSMTAPSTYRTHQGNTGEKRLLILRDIAC